MSMLQCPKPYLSSASLQIAGQGKSLRAAAPGKKAVSAFSLPLSQLLTLTLFGTPGLPLGVPSAPYPSCLHHSPNDCRLHPI